MTNDEALTEYGSALGFVLTYWDGPERDEDPNWWFKILVRERNAWKALQIRGLLRSDEYEDLILRTHRDANSLRTTRRLK
jgi:hypothetical protein